MEKTMAPHLKVLMYHRVDTPDTDPWNICVAPDVFEEQIRYFTSRYPILSVAQVVQQLSTSRIEEDSLCITFDDGYADNFENARPILEKYNCPATFFIPTAFIGSPTPFWWDELEYLLLHVPELPGQLRLPIHGEMHHYRIQDTHLTEEDLRQHTTWKWYEEPPTDRCATFLSVWEKLRPLPQADIEQSLSVLRSWAANPVPVGFRLPMNRQQLQQHFSNPLFTPGLHTHTHPDLASKDKAFQLQEIEQCRHLLQAEYGLAATCLAYPYGRYNAATLQAVKEADVAACFTTEAFPVVNGQPLTTLGRYQVNNYGVDDLKASIGV